MAKAEDLINSKQWKSFYLRMIYKLKLNEDKSLNVNLSYLFSKLQQEFLEVERAYYENVFSGIDFNDEFEDELADLANMCYLLFIRLNGYYEK